MRRIQKISLAISVATLAIGGIAYAQMSGDRPELDANGDGVITRAEAQTASTAMFAKMDANKDGKLDQSDREAHRSEMLGNRFAMLDTDKNGSISRQEFMTGHEGMRGPGGPGMDGHEGHRMDGHHGRHGGRHGGMMKMKMADANNDGTISQAEFTAAANKRFETADANKDGKISKEERDAAHQKMKAEWKAGKTPTPGATN